ncbi:MAG: dipeptidyl peptidase 3 [Flavobacteriales bacterium]|nr:dipeptidyl peptidase 3 [Flavobacteriales bacterium]
MKHLIRLSFSIFILTFMACGDTTVQNQDDTDNNNQTQENTEFDYMTEQIADLKILRYQIPGFENLKKKEKQLVYYLYQAALSGRDIVWDQNYKHNLCIRRTLEAIVNSYEGDRTTDDFKKFMTYTKRVWFSNGIHHHYAKYKFEPEFSETYFTELLNSLDKNLLPLEKGESYEAFLGKITKVMFDQTIAPKKVNLDPSIDLVAKSAVNFYDEDITTKEAEAFYDKMIDKGDPNPISYGLNSKVVREGGQLKEKVWKIGGMYSKAIEKIVFWLEKAVTVAENPNQKRALEKLVAYYKSGDLKMFDEYNIAWVNDVNSVVDVVNGFIETYEDPLSKKGSFESVLSIRDFEASKRIQKIGSFAQWFEDNSPISDEHKKENVTGISAKVITVVVESGDASPSTPIGINLPNSNWIREKHGSKSVQLGNIVHAYDMASKGSGFLQEFCIDEEEIKRSKEFGSYSDVLHTDMHEVIGHASGKINEGISSPDVTLKNYASTLEEARADLVALYYLYDEKLVEIGVMESLEYGKAAYDDYIRNGLMTQLMRLELGEDLEEAHMRNRQLVAKWVYEKGMDDNVVEKKEKDGKTYFVVNDYGKLKTLFGELLKEIQRIKSEGDYDSGKALVEDYGVKVDRQLHNEVLDRYEKLNIAPYSGFINPILVPVMNDQDEIVDVKVEYTHSFKEQMLYYAKEYSFLPTYN